MDQQQEISRGGILEMQTLGSPGTIHWESAFFTRRPGDPYMHRNPRIHSLTGSPKGWELIELTRANLLQNPAVSALPTFTLTQHKPLLTLKAAFALSDFSRAIPSFMIFPALLRDLIKSCSSRTASRFERNPNTVLLLIGVAWITHSNICLVLLTSDLPCGNLASWIKWPVHQGECSYGLDHRQAHFENH